MRACMCVHKCPISMQAYFIAHLELRLRVTALTFLYMTVYGTLCLIQLNINILLGI